MQRHIPYIFAVCEEGKDEAAEKLAAAICTPESESAAVVHDFKSSQLKDLLKTPTTIVFYGQTVAGKFGGYSAFEFFRRVKDHLQGRENHSINLWLIGSETSSPSRDMAFAQYVVNSFKRTAFRDKDLRVYAIARPTMMKSDEVFCIEVITHSSRKKEQKVICKHI